MRRWITLLVVSAILTSCGEEQDVRTFTGPDVDAIRDRYSALAAVLNKKDAASVAAFYDCCGLIAEPNLSEPSIRIGVERNNDALLADALSNVTLGYPAIEVSGDLAVSRSECRFTRTDPQTRRAKLWYGYCMHSWRRRADGTWRVAWESRNVLPLGGLQ
jgi:ketosteroid isomerase-like protein